MPNKWELGAAPAFAKIAKGQVVSLSIYLPPYDGETKRLDELSLADRVKAGWYQVDAPAPHIADPMPGDPPAFYELLGVDDKTGIARFSMEQADRVVIEATPEMLRKAAYEKESDALVIRAVRLLLPELSGDASFEAAKEEALTKVAEIKARHPDKES